LNIKKYNIPPKNAKYRILLDNKWLAKILFLKKYYPCGKFERVLFTFAVWLLFVYLINKRAQLKK